MVVTSLKSMEEIRLGHIFSFPQMWTVEPWIKAWSTACIGMDCNGISPGFWKSIQILVPSTVLSIFIGALTGYALSFWRVKWADLFLGTLLLGAFLPGQVFIYPLVKLYAMAGLSGTLAPLIITHVIFGLPVQTILFQNFFSAFPQDLFKAARVDGVGFFQIFFWVVLPMSFPIIVVGAILKVTWVWNDFLLGVVFGGIRNRPMTVQLMNLVSPSEAEVLYNVNMAATILTALVPLLVYFFSGRWFIRGISAGAVKG